MSRLVALVLLLGFPAAVFSAEKSQPRSLDPELQIELFAEQPTIVTPTGIDVDYKGRVFAVESNTHFRPKGYTGHPSDRVLVLQDTNGDGKADKTTVFTDGLTHTMSVKVKPLWLEIRSQKSEVGGRKKQKTKDKSQNTNPQSAILNPQSVYVATRRAIYLYHDTNGDLKADRRKRIIKLDTKGNYPHNGLAGIAFDAMGWMYFGFGENLGADYTIIGSDGTKLSGGGEGGNLYRCRPDGSKLSQWATGFWNPHASCVDAFGRLFTVDNDPDSRPPCRLLHIIEGGDYGFRFRNGRKGLHPFTAWNGEIPGTLPMVAGTGEAPSGIVAYESDGFPKKYIGNLLVGSWGDHRIDRFVLKPKGASFVSRAEPIIQGGEDFRPVGLAVAPDGSVFCTDWVKRDYKLHGHGRVWRISRKVEAKREVVDLATITAKKRKADELVSLLSHARLDVRRMAARAIVKAGGEPLIGLTHVVRNQTSSSRLKAECIWSAATFDADPDVIEPQVLGKWSSLDRELFDVLMEVIIELSRNSGGDPGILANPYLKYFVVSSKNKDALRYRNRLKSTTSWIPVHRHLNWDARVGERGNATQQAIFALARNGDPFHFAALLTVLRQAKADLFLDAILNSKNPPPRAYALALLAKRGKNPKNTTVLRAALRFDSPDVRRVAVQWVAEENLKQLKPQVEAVLNGKVMNADLFLATLAALEMLDGKSPKDFDKTPAGKYVLPLVKDRKRSPAVRAMALRLADPDDKRLGEQLFSELLQSKNAKLKTEAVRALQQSQRRFAGKLLAAVALDEKTPATLRADAVAGLAGRSIDDPKTLRSLLGLASSRQQSIRVEATRAFRNHLMKTAIGRPLRIKLIREIGAALKQDPQVFRRNVPLRRVAETLAAGYRDAGIALPAELQGVVKLRPKTVAGWYLLAKPQAGKDAGNVDAGRRVFFASNGASCFRCHTVNGRGGNIGPDLSTIARTADRRKLAESILEPSKEIAPQFTLWSFLMEDGKTHHGIILGDTRNGKRQRIGTADGRTVDLPLNQIELRKPQDKSVMPEKLIDRLTATEFRDLLAFLESLK